MIKVGIMGGAFNPVHFGHLILAELAFEQAGLERVLFMPLKNPPHKSKSQFVSEEHRSNMIELAIEPNPHFELSNMELAREGNTYTADTLTLLTNANPDTEYYFIVGADSFLAMQNWWKPQTIFELSTIIVAGRNMASEDLLNRQYELLREKYNARVIFLDMPNIDISSSNIRERIAEHKTIRYFVPDKVWEYMMEHQLYLDTPEEVL